jgi:hypothetical protein
MFAIESKITRLGGIASSGDLYSHPNDREFLRIAHRYGRIIHICRGWWATLDVPDNALDARRAGGRLACVSAMRFYKGERASPSDEALHVAVPRNASRLRGRSKRAVIYHWGGDDVGGSILAVSVTTAEKQMARCDAVER